MTAKELRDTNVDRQTEGGKERKKRQRESRRRVRGLEERRISGSGEKC